MRRSSSLLCMLLLALSACDDHGDDGVGAIRLNDASEEVLNTLADAVNSGLLVVDDTKAEQLTAPSSGSTVSLASPPTFTWAKPSPKKTPRHGIYTGEFTWIRFEGSGLAAAVDVIAVDTTTWTPIAIEWMRFMGASGTVTVTVTTAYVDGGTIMEGPFRAAPSITLNFGP